MERMRTSRICRINRVGMSAAAPFPTTISGLSFWFQADPAYTDVGVGSAVGTWTDRFAGATFTQATGSLKGTLTAITGANYLVLDATDDGYAGSASLTGSYTLMVHGIKGTDAADARRTLVSPSVNALISLTNRNDTGRWYLAGVVDGKTDAAGSGRITVGMTVAASPGVAKAYLDGVDVTSGAPVTGADWGTVNLAKSGTNGEQADASVRHILGYSRVLTAAEMLMLHTWLGGN